MPFDLAALNRELSVSRSLVAHDQLELGAEHVGSSRSDRSRPSTPHRCPIASTRIAAASANVFTFEVFHMNTILMSESTRPTQLSSAVLKRTPVFPSFSSSAGRGRPDRKGRVPSFGDAP